MISRIALVAGLIGAASARIIMQSTFDLEIAAKSEHEQKYHDFILPLMQAMVNDKNLSALRALHPLLNPGRDSRANGIFFEFADFNAFTSFVSTYHLHFLSLSTFWKNWKSSIWKAVPLENSGPFITRESAEGKYYFLVQQDFALKPGGAAAYQSAVDTLFTRTIPALKQGGHLVQVGHAVEAGGSHSHATHRITYEFDSWDGVNALLTGSDWTSFINAATHPTTGFWSSWSRDLVVAPAPVALVGAAEEKP